MPILILNSNFHTIRCQYDFSILFIPILSPYYRPCRPLYRRHGRGLGLHQSIGACWRAGWEGSETGLICARYCSIHIFPCFACTDSHTRIAYYLLVIVTNSIKCSLVMLLVLFLLNSLSYLWALSLYSLWIRFELALNSFWTRLAHFRFSSVHCASVHPIVGAKESPVRYQWLGPYQTCRKKRHSCPVCLRGYCTVL